jgi:iron(III) transport system substrate-binding protein
MLGLLLIGCRVEIGPPDGPVAAVADAAPTGEVWVYTSMYQSVIDAIDPQIRAAYPGLEPRWFQAGSEKVAQRVEAEWASGGSPACLLMTSDPFWYADLRDQGRLEPYLATSALHVDRGLVDPDGYWIASRISLMLLGVDGARVPADARPHAFADLGTEPWRGRIAMPDPLASGTAFTTIAFLDRDAGDPLAAMRANGMVASGGNSAVLAKLESGEKDAGILLLENVLAARRKGSTVEAVFPTDGAVAIPGPIAITAGCPNPGGARAIYEFILSDAGQRAIVAGDMYAALPELPPPDGGPALDAIAVRPWPRGFVGEVVAGKQALKDRWAAP